MEQALRLKSPALGVPGGYTLVYIQAEVDNLGPDVVRAGFYVCPDQRCHVRVFPAIPERVPKKREKVPRPYFREGNNDKHKLNCNGDTGWIVAASPTPQPQNQPMATAVARRIPVRWRDLPAVTTTLTGSVAAPPSAGTASRSSSGRPGGGQMHISESEVSSVRALVHFWLNEQPHIRRERIALGQSTAKTWDELFWDVSQVASQQMPSKDDRRLFYGPIKSAIAYGKKAWLLVFDAVTGQNKELAIWLPTNLEPLGVSAEIEKRAKQIGAGTPPIAYVLGALRFGHGRFSVNVESAKCIWIGPV